MIDFGKHRIIFDGLRHYYRIDLNNLMDIIPDSSSPVYMKILGKQLRSKIYGEMLVFLSETLLEELQDIDLLEFKTDWTRQNLFSQTKQTNFRGPISNGLYVNCNHSTIRILMMMRDLLKFCSIDFNEFELFIRMAPKYEKKEIKDHFKTKNIEKFYSFLITDIGKTESAANSILNSLQNFDKIFGNKYHNYESMFLFESGQDFSNYCSKFKIEIVDNLPSLTETQKDRLKIYLDYLKSYYYKVYS